MNEPPDDPGGGLTPLEVPEASNFITYPPNCPPREESDGSFFDTDASENTNTSTLKRKRVSVRKICKQCNKKKRKHRKVDGPVPSNECQCIFDDEMAVPTQSLGNNFTPPAPLHSSTPLLNESNVSQRVQPPPTEQPSAPVARPRPSKGYNRSEHETLTRDYNTPFAPSKSILMSLTIQQIILDAKRLAGRLKERETEADALLTETQTAYRQIHTMKQYKEEIDTLNEASRDRPRGALIGSIERESRLMRDVQRENGELRAALEDHRRALELIMSKYRQHTEKRVWESRIDFTNAINEKQQELIRQQAERINEMTSIMYKAVTLDENSDARKEEELYQRLITENKGLREMLDLSRRYGSDRPCVPLTEDKDVQTDGPPLSGA
ncbi:unnamed protein product [Spodoptera exigua]|nr:unnamed protein product [Spodoptera exigua]